MKPEELERMQQRQTFQNVWHIPLTKATTTDPAYCCFATWCVVVARLKRALELLGEDQKFVDELVVCPTCASYQLRRRALYGDMTRYVCCGGYMPCSGKVKEKQCPEFCLGIEACFCFVQSVMTTRWMLQDEFRIQTTPCDNCLISFMFVIRQLSCICSLLACLTGSDELKDIAECLRIISDIVTCVVTSSMMTQHKVEMDKRDGLIEVVPEAAMGAPPLQQMSRTDHAVPPPADGIPVQPAAYVYPAHTPGLHPPVFALEPNPGLYPPVFTPGPYPPLNPGLAPPNPGQLPPPVFDPGPHPPPNQDQPPPVSGPGHPPPPQKMM